jgi:beta-glucosidase
MRTRRRPDANDDVSRCTGTPACSRTGAADSFDSPRTWSAMGHAAGRARVKELPAPAMAGMRLEEDGMVDGQAAGTDRERTTDAAIRSRVEELIAGMTVAEKAGQLTQYFYFGSLQESDAEPSVGGVTARAATVEAALGQGEAGSLLFVTDPAQINRLQRLAVEGNRLGIPVLFGYDVIHGLRTILPVPIAMAASWDPETIERGQSVAAREARAVGLHWAFAPMVDIARDPRWGRIVEGAGEDPFLGAAVAVAQVRGFQGQRIGAPERIIAGPKHFAGYGAALGGRDYDEVELSDSQLWNVYLPPFAAAVAAGAGNVMTAYMDLNGIPATGNRWLFTDVLRDTLGFEGFVVSDANAVRNLVTHGFAADLTDAGARALEAGVDMEMAIAEPAYAHLPDAVASGMVSEETLDARVRCVLEAKLRLGLFDDPYVDEDRARDVLADPAHREVARVAAERSAVLLRNEGDLLPLDLGSLGSIAVIGPLADSRRDTLGPWCFDFDLDETVTVLQGIRDKAGGTARVEYAGGVRPAQRVFASMFDMFPGNAPEDPEGFDDEAELERAVDLARAADVAVVVLGEWQNMIGEAASRSSLELPGGQLELLQAVAQTGTPVVLLVMNGRPLDLRWAAEHVPAILDIWYPGTQGGAAVANLLFGDVSPGGKLPFTWPRTVGQIPMVYSHTQSHEPENQARRYWDEESTPLFSFGHGLAYARFDYANLSLDRDAIGPDETLTVSVDVSNTGGREADEVVQLYLHQRHGSASRPVRELKGFERIRLEAGETRAVRFSLGPAELRYWNAAARDWVIDASTFDVWVGGDSTAELSTTFAVTTT